MTEWQTYQQIITIPSTVEKSPVMWMIEERFNRAGRQVQCYLAHTRILLYGWWYCVECNEWTAPPMEDTD